ncbi:hypothetical protein DC20_12330 [Rufibacter tibetensis]|uniref:Uncharacterized protein n=2 Tax=Rufibacter tibetensis TaxID=512763 RepID=A0A0P0CCZ0_9BACT|nr:hypothetical protein DC20_12330 [Rufibacter tibetensis]
MGVVSGLVDFSYSGVGYDFIKSYCIKKKVELVADYPEDKLISTKTIEGLIVLNSIGVEIKGLGYQLGGMDSEGFDIAIEGIPYPFYGEEFPQHLKNYENKDVK